MSFDYSGLLNTATTLIDRFGRDATLRLPEQISADPARPWEGPDVGTPDVEAIPVRAVFFDLLNDAFTITGAGIGRGSTPAQERRSRVFVEAAVALPEEVATNWELDDGLRRYAVTSVSPQQPGPTLLYYVLQVRL